MPEGQEKASAECRSPPQELEEGPRSGPHLLVLFNRSSKIQGLSYDEGNNNEIIDQFSYLPVEAAWSQENLARDVDGNQAGGERIACLLCPTGRQNN